MRNSFRVLACVLAASAAMTGMSVVPSLAQTTVTNTVPPAARSYAPHRRRHVFHSGIGSAASRNVGPSSTVTGNRDTVGGGHAGAPNVPGAPAAGPASGGSGQ